MTRFLGAFCVAVLLLGSVAACQWWMTREVAFQVTRDVDHHEDHAADGAGPVDLVLTPAFTAVDDPFALRTADGISPRLLVRHGETELLRHTTDIRAGEPVRVAEVTLAGEVASIQVEANPTPEEAVRPCALRVEVFRDGVLCDDQTIWSEGGGTRPSAVLNVQLTPRLRKLDRGLGKSSE